MRFSFGIKAKATIAPGLLARAKVEDKPVKRTSKNLSAEERVERKCIKKVIDLVSTIQKGMKMKKTGRYTY